MNQILSRALNINHSREQNIFAYAPKNSCQKIEFQ